MGDSLSHLDDLLIRVMWDQACRFLHLDHVLAKVKLVIKQWLLQSMHPVLSTRVIEM